MHGVRGRIDSSIFGTACCLFGAGASVFGSCDALTGLDCTREGVVTRNIGEYATADFAHNVFKYVRKGHVQTGEHWTRHWKRARLVWELRQEKGGNR